MIGDEYITLTHIPSADAVAAYPGICKDVIDLRGSILHETVVSHVDSLGEVDHSGLLRDVDDFFAAGLCVHIAREDARSIGEEGLFLHLPDDLLNTEKPGRMAFVIKMGIDHPEYLVRFELMKGGFRTNAGAIALDLIAGTGNIGCRREPVGIQLNEVEAAGQESDAGLLTGEAFFPGTTDDIVFVQVLLEPYLNMGEHFLEANDIGHFGTDLP